MSPLLTGVYAPIGTPFVNEEVAYDQLASNVQKYASSKLSGYLAIGSNGECVSFSEQEKDKVLETVVANKAAQQKVLAGARELHLVLGRLNSSVSGSYGVAGVKYASEVAGFHGGDPRLPLLPLSDSDKDSIRQAIEATDLSPYM